MNHTTLETAFYNAIYAIVSPIACIWDAQNSPAPAHPYMVMTFNSTQVKHDTAIQLSLAVTGVINYVDDIEIMANIRGFGSGIIEKTELVRAALHKESIRAILAAGGLVFVNVGDVIDTTALEGSKFLESSSMDIRLRTAEEITETVGIIQSISGVGNIQPIDKDIPYTIGAPYVAPPVP